MQYIFATITICNVFGRNQPRSIRTGRRWSSGAGPVSFIGYDGAVSSRRECENVGQTVGGDTDGKAAVSGGIGDSGHRNDQHEADTHGVDCLVPRRYAKVKPEKVYEGGRL